MILESPCKINLGLDVLRKREDGFHDLESVMYEVAGKPDLVEIKPSGVDEFSSSGIIVDCPVEKNLCVRAVELLRSEGWVVPPSHIHLHKQTPFGAGLGGGSANATTVLKICNDLYGLSLGKEQLRVLAARLGSDTAFFVEGGAQLAQGRGEILSPLNLSLKGYYIYIVMPQIHISTAQAFAGIKPQAPKQSLAEVIHQPIQTWKNNLKNDFETSLFPQFTQLSELKETLYNAGAIYASLSGSGAALYGIFEKKTNAKIPFLWHIEECK